MLSIHLGIGDGRGNRVAAINPRIDDTDPIRKISIEPGSHTDPQNPAELSRKGKAGTEFQYRPRIADTDTIVDAFFVGTISETSNSWMSLCLHIEGESDALALCARLCVAQATRNKRCVCVCVNCAC